MKKSITTSIALLAAFASIIPTSLSCSKLTNLLNASVSMQNESVNVTVPVTTRVNGVISVGQATNNHNVDSLNQNTNRQPHGNCQYQQCKICLCHIPVEQLQSIK